jgi:hypothetical protein
MRRPYRDLFAIVFGLSMDYDIPDGPADPGTSASELFAERCASCHALAAVGSDGTVGPDLDEIAARGASRPYRVGPMTLGRATYEPGWRWSKHVGAQTGERLCQVENVGLVLEGRTVAADRALSRRAHAAGSGRSPRLPGRTGGPRSTR